MFTLENVEIFRLKKDHIKKILICKMFKSEKNAGIQKFQKKETTRTEERA
jgi:hypothetical protein